MLFFLFDRHNYIRFACIRCFCSSMANITPTVMVNYSAGSLVTVSVVAAVGKKNTHCSASQTGGEVTN